MRNLDWRIVLYAVLSLTVVRMLPVALSLRGSGVTRQTNVFLGWFGPRGTASILYLFTVIEVEDLPGTDIVYTAAVVTVLFSVFAHGLSAAPLANWYGRLLKNKDLGEGTAEMRAVPEMPTRGPLKREEW